MSIPSEKEEETNKAFLNPQVGDTFHEMFSYWFTIIDISEDGAIKIWEHHQQNVLIFKSAEDFRYTYAYGSIPGYSVRLNTRGNDVSDIIDHINSSEFEGKIIDKAKEKEKRELQELENRYNYLLSEKCTLITKLEQVESNLLELAPKFYSKKIKELHEP